MNKPYSYEYPRPALTADIIALRWKDNQLEVLLILRGNEPFKDYWALPGGFVNEGESPAKAAARECLEETSVSVRDEDLIEIGCFASPHRDPRGWNASIAFLALLPSNTEAQSGDDASATKWVPWNTIFDDTIPLAFDHLDILQKTQERLKTLSLTTPQLTKLFEVPFRTRHIRYLYRQLWGEMVTPRSFKAWVRKVDMVERVGRSLFKAKGHLRLPWI